MNLLELIGREASIPGEGRRRVRGFICQLTDDGKLLFSSYGELAQREEHAVEPGEVRLLKAGPLSGWRAIDVAEQDGTPWISMRVRPHIVAALDQLAAEHDETVEWAFNEMIRIGFESLERRGALRAAC